MLSRFSTWTDLPLEIRQLRRSPCPFRLEPIEVELRDDALLKPKLGQPDCFLPRLEGALGNLYLVIQSPEIEVRLCHVADQSEDHRALILRFR